MTTTLLLDNSAWVRLGDTALPAARANEIADALESGRVGACLPFLLEAGYSARNAREHEELLFELRSLPDYHIDGLSSSVRLTRRRNSLASDIIACRPSTCSSQRSPTATGSACCTTTATTT